MTRRLFLVVMALALSASFGPAAAPRSEDRSIPTRLSDRDYWKLITDTSEPNGFFRSDNLLSNELTLQYVIPDLLKTARPDRVYVGVGPEQNFTYIAALRPRMVFIVDIRRGNLQLHLMYKALFEMSPDRADFVSRLFSKPRPPALTSTSTVADIFSAYEKVQTSEPLYKKNLKAIQDHLVRKHKFALTAEDLKGIEYVYYHFFWYGPSLHYWSSGSRGGRNAPTYADLMMADDGKGHARSYLASEESFAFLKGLHSKNLFVPVVGNFAGSRALRSVGKYVRDRGGRISAFYLSNVEQYLQREGVWHTFCDNVATLPLDESSTFIRSVRSFAYSPGVGLDSELGNISTEVKSCSASARR